MEVSQHFLMVPLCGDVELALWWCHKSTLFRNIWLSRKTCWWSCVTKFVDVENTMDIGSLVVPWVFWIFHELDLLQEKRCFGDLDFFRESWWFLEVLRSRDNILFCELHWCCEFGWIVLRLTKLLPTSFATYFGNFIFMVRSPFANPFVICFSTSSLVTFTNYLPDDLFLSRNLFWGRIFAKMKSLASLKEFWGIIAL